MGRMGERWSRMRGEYVSRKAYFVKKSREWEENGWHSAARHVGDLVKEADEISADITRLIASKDADKKEIERRILKFSYVYKDLAWSTTAIWRQWAGVGGAAALVILIAVLIGFPRRISVPSCEPKIYSGDIVWEDRFSARINWISKGDIVSFHSPECPKCLNKKRSLFGKIADAFGFPGACSIDVGRVVAVAGDRIEGILKSGDAFIVVNGEIVSQSSNDNLLALNDKNEVVLPSLASGEDLFDEIIVPSRCCWVIGDNRKCCRDSRHWGALALSSVKGKVRWRLYKSRKVRSS